MHRQPQGGIQILGAQVGYDPVIMQRQVQQVLVRVLDNSVAWRDGGGELEERGRDPAGAVLGMVVDAPVVVQRQVPWLGRAMLCLTMDTC